MPDTPSKELQEAVLALRADLVQAYRSLEDAEERVPAESVESFIFEVGEVIQTAHGSALK